MAEKNETPPDIANLSFEEAFARLEQTVEAMESEQLPLEELIENYEAGTRWQQICRKRLEEAEGRIEIIRKKAGGEVVLEPFDPDSDPSSEPVAEETETKPARTDDELF